MKIGTYVEVLTYGLSWKMLPRGFCFTWSADYQGLCLQDGTVESVHVCCRSEKNSLEVHKLNKIKEEN